MHLSDGGVEFFSVFLRKLAAAFSLCGLLATSSVASASVCRVMCASRAESRGMSARHHEHHSSQPAGHRSMQSHAAHNMAMQESPTQQDWLAAGSARCSEYQPLSALLEGLRTSSDRTMSDSSRVAGLPVSTAVPDFVPVHLRTESSSPPQSDLLNSAVPTQLRI